MVDKQYQVFCKEIREQSGRHARFDLDLPNLQLGDYGYLEDGVFQYLGNAANEGWLDKKDLKSIIGKSSGTPYAYWSNGVIKSDGSVLADADIVKGKVVFKFTKDNQFFFCAKPTKTKTMENIRSAGDKLKSYLKEGKWNQNFCLVTSVTYTKPTKIIIGSEGGASITGQAKSSNKLSIFAEIAALFHYKSDKKTTQVREQKNEITSLFQLFTFNKKFFSESWEMAKFAVPADTKELTFEEV